MEKAELQKAKKNKKNKKIVEDLEEEWTCKVCFARYSSETIRGLVKKWIECDGCQAQFHLDCIPKKHRNDIHINSQDSEEEIEFICHFCVVSDTELCNDDSNSDSN